jgi:hypothetical protein
MAIDTEIHYANLDQLSLDPMNVRLGRNNAGPNVSQEKVLDLMKDWTLDELAVSFLENGFWPQEALLVVKEKLYGQPALVVVEGNRRLAALKMLFGATHGEPSSRKWTEIAAEKNAPAGLFDKIPYLLASSRKDVLSFLGFRHVTGIMEWQPAEKAEFIAKLIEDSGMGYEEVMRRIGSKTQTVRQNYISFRLLLQMEDLEAISLKHVEDRFSVLYLSLRTEGAQKYLHIDIEADPEKAKRPVPKAHYKALVKFALWLFGDEKTPPVVTDSRQIDDFGTILESPKALEYLERSERPVFEVAYRIAGGDEPELIKLIQQAADNVESALSRAHLYSRSKELKSAVERLGEDTFRLLEIFPDIRKSLLASPK